MGIIQTQTTVFTKIYKRLTIRRPHYRIAYLNDICHLLGFDNFLCYFIKNISLICYVICRRCMFWLCYVKCFFLYGIYFVLYVM